MAIFALTERICVRGKGRINSEEFLHGLKSGRIFAYRRTGVCHPATLIRDFKWTRISPMFVILGAGLVEALLN
jgi:hypothetical protein